VTTPDLWECCETLRFCWIHKNRNHHKEANLHFTTKTLRKWSCGLHKPPPAASITPWTNLQTIWELPSRSNWARAVSSAWELPKVRTWASQP